MDMTLLDRHATATLSSLSLPVERRFVVVDRSDAARIGMRSQNEQKKFISSNENDE